MTRPRRRPPTAKRHVEGHAEPLRTPVAQAVSPGELARLEALARTLEAAEAYQRRNQMINPPPREQR
jgi:hypothetical protein